MNLQTHDEGPSLGDTPSGAPTVRYGGRSLYSTRDPVGRAEAAVPSESIPDDTLVIVPSPLLGYGLDRLLSLLPERALILCIETDQRLMALSLRSLKSPLANDSRIRFLRLDEPSVAVEYVAGIGLWNFRRTLIVPLSGGYALDRARYDAIRTVVDEEIRRYWRNRMTTLHMGRLWMRNLFGNIVRFERDASGLRTDRCVAVVGAGESLESAIPNILRFRRALYLIAVDTALPVLSDSGIIPDLVFALEGQVVNVKDFIGSTDVRSALVCDLVSHPVGPRLFPGRTWFFLSRFTETRLFVRLAAFGVMPMTIPALGSVGIAALDFAIRLGRDRPVFAAGLDFSFIPGKPHAKGAPFHRLASAAETRLAPCLLYDLTLRRPFRMLPGKNGMPVASDAVLESYAAQASTLIASSKTAVYDLGCDSRIGLPIGMTPTGGIEGMISILADSERFSGHSTEGERNGYGDNAPRTRTSSAAKSRTELMCRLREFIVSEEHLLDETVRAVEAALSSGTSESMAIACGCLSETDYVYLDFPDHPPLPRTDRGFLFRAAASAAFYRERVRQAKAEVEVTAAASTEKTR